MLWCCCISQIGGTTSLSHHNSLEYLLYAVTHLSQFLSDPVQAHYDVALRILRYLKGTSAMAYSSLSILPCTWKDSLTLIGLLVLSLGGPLLVIVYILVTPSSLSGLKCNTQYLDLLLKLNIAPCLSPLVKSNGWRTFYKIFRSLSLLWHSSIAITSQLFI